jgi:hypothetical protein
MKKIIIVFLLAFISTASSFMIPTVYAQSISFKGFGAWRDKDNKAGQYRTHRDILWSECRNKCMNSRSCTGVEYSYRSNGKSTCEIHTGKLSHVDKISPEIGIGTVWLKYTGSGTSPSSSGILPRELMEIPDYIKLDYSGRSIEVIVDFSAGKDTWTPLGTRFMPQITIPADFIRGIPWYEGKPILPTNFCGIKINKPVYFYWSGRGLLQEPPFGYVPRDSTVERVYGPQYAEEIRIGGPMGSCFNDVTLQWVFEYPLTDGTHPAGVIGPRLGPTRIRGIDEILVIVFEPSNAGGIEFITSNLNPTWTPPSHDQLFKPVDWNKIMKFFEEMMRRNDEKSEEVYGGFGNWVDLECIRVPNHPTCTCIKPGC